MDRPVSDAAALLSRRAWLGSVALACGGFAHGQEEAEPDEALRAAVEARAGRAGLGPLGETGTAHYLALGNAPERFRASAVQTCETIALDFLDYYRAQGFAVWPPEGRLVLLVLADRRAFVRYVGTALSDDVAGVYRRDTNELVVYDHRASGQTRASTRARFLNQMSLAHEATHQLAYNSGLTNRKGDVPACIAEGLALYGETRRTNGRSQPGMMNQERLRSLAYLQRRGLAWIPAGRLFVEGGHDGTEDERGLFYAESWLLVHFLMKDPARRPAFRAYLKAIHDRTTADARLDDARAHLGDLDRLDEDLRRYGLRLLKGG